MNLVKSFCSDGLCWQSSEGVAMKNSGAGGEKCSFGWWIYSDQHCVKKSITRNCIVGKKRGLI
jgi:hypothetical protein